MTEKDKEFELKFDKKLFKSIINTMISLALCFIIAKVITGVLIVNAKVPSSSMETTIMTGDRLVANRLSYLNKTPVKGEIIVFEDPDEDDKLLIKRVIGTPGDKIQILDGALYLNDELQDEPYIREEMVGSFGPYYVPEDSYFMLGDNRNYSYDARYWENTYIHKDEILGKAMFTYYPKIKVIK